MPEDLTTLWLALADAHRAAEDAAALLHKTLPALVDAAKVRDTTLFARVGQVADGVRWVREDLSRLLLPVQGEVVQALREARRPLPLPPAPEPPHTEPHGSTLPDYPA